MTAATASMYARKLVSRQTMWSGTKEAAYAWLDRNHGLTRAQIRHLKDGRAKTVDAGLFARLRAAYLDLCERELAKLQHEIAVERAIEDADVLADIEAKTEDLVAALNEARSRSQRR